MGGGNAQKSATARQRNLEKASGSKVKPLFPFVFIFSGDVFGVRTLAVVLKVRKHEQEEIWLRRWPPHKVTLVACSKSHCYFFCFTAKREEVKKKRDEKK
jgi:hypothetical protein